MLEKFKKFIEKIRDSDENVKKSWLIASSAVTMVLVIGFWLIYMNWMLNPPDEAAQKQELETGFWQIFKTGLSVVAESIWNNIQNFFQKITGERIIEIQ